jgi:hypothetical protein
MLFDHLEDHLTMCPVCFGGAQFSQGRTPDNIKEVVISCISNEDHFTILFEEGIPWAAITWGIENTNFTYGAPGEENAKFVEFVFEDFQNYKYEELAKRINSRYKKYSSLL